MSEVLGGSHSEVTGAYPKDKNGKALPHKYEAHHIWAAKSYQGVFNPKLSYGQGPAIRMNNTDHQATKSWGKSNEAQDFRNKQRKMLEKGQYREAWEMGVQDIKNACKKNGKPENTYDQHINQTEKYVLNLHRQGKIKLDNKFRAELEQRQKNFEKKQGQTQTTQNLQQNQQPQKQVFTSNHNPFSQQKDKGRSH